VLQELGLSPALEWLGEEIERTFGIVVSVADDGLPKPLAPTVRSILYRAVRELLINVAKHAQTDSASVTVECEAGRVYLKISDFGIGFDITAAPDSGRRPLGLISVRERLSYVGGIFDLSTTPGEGTTVTLSAPLWVGDSNRQDSNA
jgi:signal transduction histidine kinase